MVSNTYMIQNDQDEANVLEDEFENEEDFVESSIEADPDNDYHHKNSHPDQFLSQS